MATNALRNFIAQHKLDRSYDGFDASAHALDLQGWNEKHPIFESLINELRPSTIIEVGTWKGASALHMAALARRHNKDCVILCVDTFLGSSTFYRDPSLYESLRTKHGLPQIYWQFLANVVHTGFASTVFPLPLTSTSAAVLIRSESILVDLVYIDAAHSELECYTDISEFWPTIRSGGIMFGDDYGFGGVKLAVERFAAENRLPVTKINEKWSIQRP